MARRGADTKMHARGWSYAILFLAISLAGLVWWNAGHRAHREAEQEAHARALVAYARHAQSMLRSLEHRLTQWETALGSQHTAQRRDSPLAEERQTLGESIKQLEQERSTLVVRMETVMGQALGAWPRPEEAAAQDFTPRRSWLGVRMQKLTSDLRLQLGVQATSGVVVTDVVGHSPAAQADIRRKDVMTRVWQQTVQEPEEVARRIGAAPPGTRVEVEVLRGSEKRIHDVTLDPRDFTDILFKNECHRPLRTAIHYKDLSNQWVTAGWQTLQPGAEAWVALTRNQLYYYYAEFTDGQLVGAGQEFYTTIDGSSTTYGFRKAKIGAAAWGEREHVPLTCK
ncbi:MAG: PDZ domain-containing protein [Deltaproteobacteria bacterium]|nr:PDZ domain-containing protein [Deltaproteobacteria bacterium]